MDEVFFSSSERKAFEMLYRVAKEIYVDYISVLVDDSSCSFVTRLFALSPYQIDFHRINIIGQPEREGNELLRLRW